MHIESQPTSCVQPIGKKKVGEKVQKCLWERPDLPNCQPNLLEPNGRVARSFGYFRAWALLLENKPPDAEYNPICKGSQSNFRCFDGAQNLHELVRQSAKLFEKLFSWSGSNTLRLSTSVSRYPILLCAVDILLQTSENHTKEPMDKAPPYLI